MGTQARVAIVAGGGQGIGRTIALRLVRDGIDLVLAGPDPDGLHATAAEIRSLGGHALAVVADVSREGQVGALDEQARAAFGRIDVLVNSAAIIGPTAPVARVRRGEWDEVIAVNLTGALLCRQVVLPEMIARGSGKIVNIASVAGKIAYPLRSPYAESLPRSRRRGVA